MGWFGEDTPLEIYEKNLLSAVKNGHVEQIKALMTTQLDVPAAVFNKALNKAVKDDKTKTVEALLSNRTTQWSIDTQSLRDIVENGNGTMFRILHKSGWTFEGIQYTGENAYHYNKPMQLQVALWKKEIAYDALMEELQETKRQLTEKETDFPEKVKFPPNRNSQPGSGHNGGA